MTTTFVQWPVFLPLMNSLEITTTVFRGKDMIWFTTPCRTQRFSLFVSVRKHETSEQSLQVFKTMRYHKGFSIYVLDFTP